MNRRRPEIHLGDLARALQQLNWQGEDQAAAIAAHLGFGLQAGPYPADTPRPAQEIFDRQRYRAQSPAPATQPPPPIHTPPPPRPRTELPNTVLPSQLTRLEPLAPAAGDRPDWLDQPDTCFNQAEQTALARHTLFPQSTNRALLSAALAIPGAGTEVDVARLIQTVCRREPLRALPRLPRLTLEHGCQLLLDFSATMVPWWDDLTGLMDQVNQVVGEETTQVYSFDTDPAAALRWTPEGERLRWRPDGRPVLIATDFAIQGRERRGQPHSGWNEAIQRCTASGSPLMVLVPWPKTRWPRSFGAANPAPILVPWSPHTSAAMLGHRSRT